MKYKDIKRFYFRRFVFLYTSYSKASIGTGESSILSHSKGLQALQMYTSLHANACDNADFNQLLRRKPETR